MLDKREYRVYNGVKREEIYKEVCDFWTAQGFYVAQTAPFHIRGQSVNSSIGLRREFILRLDDTGNGTGIDLQFQASITDTGLVGGVVAAVIFFPVAVVGGALSYSDYESDTKNMMGGFWHFMNSKLHSTGEPSPPPFSPETSPAQQTKPCDRCGALLPENWKACPYCGEALGKSK